MKLFSIKITVTVAFFILSFQGCNTKKDDSIDKLALLLIANNFLNSICKNPLPIPGGSDPLFGSQWHLFQNSGEDAGVTEPWNMGVYGEGVNVAIVDDGLETTHPDLCGNLSSVSSYNYFKKSVDPNHFYLDSGHGTNVAGVVAAQYNNNVGLRGAAPSAKILSRNLLEQLNLGSSDIADSMIREITTIHVSNNSWGASDGFGYYNDTFASTLWKTSIDEGIASGRGGKGTIYTWAGGNGAYRRSSGSTPVDNSNMDGQANYHGVLAICGVGKDGKRAWYSEEGANLWVCAHTMGDDMVGISTTDRTGEKGDNVSGASGNFKDTSYTNNFNGTSSSAPLAAGVIALLLSRYPDLSWRDVREILAKSARKNDPSDSDWLTNGANYKISHKYGFGTIHAKNAVDTASTWTKITSPYINYETPSVTSSSSSSPYTIQITPNTTITKIEYIEVSFTSNHTEVGKIKLELKNNQTNTNSILMTPHDCYTGNLVKNTCGSFSAGTIRLGTARHLGENPNNAWTITITEPTITGKSYSAKIKFYGRVN